MEPESCWLRWHCVLQLEKMTNGKKGMEEMKSEWKVAKNPIGQDEYVYTVYRIRDTEAPDHSGNRETYDCYISEEVARLKAGELNRREAIEWQQ